MRLTRISVSIANKENLQYDFQHGENSEMQFLNKWINTLVTIVLSKVKKYFHFTRSIKYACSPDSQRSPCFKT
jgi:hypothetical protein